MDIWVSTKKAYENTLRRVLDAWNTHTDYTPVVLNAVDQFLTLK